MWKAILDRLHFWWAVLYRPLGLIVLLLWSAITNGQNALGALSRILPKGAGDHVWASALPQLQWRTWLIGILVILLLLVLEFSYRLNAAKVE